MRSIGSSQARLQCLERCARECGCAPLLALRLLVRTSYHFISILIGGVSLLATGEAGTKAPQTPYYVRALALGLPAYLIGVHLWTWVFTVPIFLGGRSDFRQLYAAGYMVRSGHAHELYDYEAQR